MNHLYIRGLKSITFTNSNVAVCMSVNNILSTECANVCKPLGIQSFHSSSRLEKFKPPKPRPTTYKKPVDWLPFPWHRRPRFNLYEQGGDTIKEIIFDPDAPKPDFEFSEEFKTANETVKKTFSLATASKNERKERMKRDILKRVQRHPFDFNSLEVDIALRTVQIRSLYEHHALTSSKEVRISRVILPILIQKRNARLHKLRNIDEARFNWLLKELDLTFTPPILGLKIDKYCKKWDLRRLTREYCEKTIAGKKEAYHQELKKEQEAFLEEKEQILAWIEAEEKALKSENLE